MDNSDIDSITGLDAIIDATNDAAYRYRLLIHRFKAIAKGDPAMTDAIAASAYNWATHTQQIWLPDVFCMTEREIRMVAEQQKRDRIHTLATMPYRDYLLTDEWHVRAFYAKQRAKWRCQVCNASAKDAQLNTHHRTYERRGNELDTDLIVLCRDCHFTFHENGKLARGES